MSYVAAATALLVFALAFKFSRIADSAVECLSCSREAFATLRSGSLALEEKEAHLQAASLRLFRHFAVITWKAAMMLAASAVPIVAFHVLDLVPFSVSVATLLSWEVLIGGALAFWVTNSR